VASYEASIKVLVEAQQAFRAIQKLENKLKNIQDKATKAQIKAQITESAQDVRRAERKLTAQIDLNAATDLYQRRLTQINRAGGARNEQQRKELAGLAKIVETQGDNARIVQKVATATGRILEVIRETNRVDKRSNQLQSQVRAYQKQIDALRDAGVAESQLRKITELRNKLSDQQQKKQLDLAAITKDQLDRKLKILQTERKLKEATEQTAAAERTKLRQQGLALRSLARGINPLIRQASGLGGPAQQLALPNTRLLGAQARGLQQIETSEERIARFAERTAQAKAKSEARSKPIMEANRASAAAAERAAKAAERTARATKATARNGGRGRGRGRGRGGGNVLVGAAFPALFGAGPAGILGGAIGEAFGPLGGVVGSALGAPVDAFVAETIKVGQALNSTGSALDLVREKSLFSSEQTKERAAKLEELGRVEELANLLTSELVSVIGNNGVTALQDLGKTTDETTRLWNELTLQLSALIAGPLNGFLSIVNQLLGRVTTGFRFDALLNDLEPEQRQQAENRLKELTQRVGTGRSAAKSQETKGISTTQAQKKVIEEFAKLVPKTAQIPVTSEDRKRFAVKGGKGVDDESRAASELLRLNAQITAEKIRQSDIGTRYRKLIFGETEGLRQQNERLNKRRDLQIQLVEQQRAQALQRNKYAENEATINKLYDARIETIKGEASLTEQQNLRRLELLDIEREITNQQRERAMMRELTSVDRTIEQTKLRAQSPFGSDEQERQLQLLDQRIRREDAFQKFLERRAALEAEIRRLPEQATTEIDNLNQRIKREEELQVSLQQRFKTLDQLEQAELRQAQIVEKYGFIADELATAMTSAVQAVVTGTGTVEEAFSTMFANIGKAFIDMATQMMAQQLFMTVIGALGGGSGFNFAGGSASSGLSAANLMGGTGPLNAGLFGRANGGPVTANQPYIVGERGPELFIPFQRGQVVSNEDSEDIMEAAFQRSGGSSNVSNSYGGGSSNVSNSYGGGSSNVSNSFQQMQMVNLPFTRTAEQASMVAAERETAQAISNPGPIDVRYESSVINNVEYVSAEQHRRGMAQAAERGRALTLEAMQNSVKFRRKGGI